MEELTPEVKLFILWLSHLNCPFSVHFNGTDPIKPKISYDKGGKNYSLEDVYKFWCENVKPG